MKKVKLYDKEFELLIQAKKIQFAVNRIALKINEDFKDKQNLLFISILNGSFMFASDLFKRIELNCKISFLKLSSYDDKAHSSGKVKKLIGLNENISNIPVIVVEDIIDSGVTIDNIVDQLKQHNPSEIKVATLLFKPSVFNKKVSIDYVGFEIPDDFVIGYGLDYKGLGRNFNDIYKLN